MDVPIPVHMCMPIDELQRRVEEMEYSELLDQVNQQFLFAIICMHAGPMYTTGCMCNSCLAAPRSTRRQLVMAEGVPVHAPMA